MFKRTELHSSWDAYYKPSLADPGFGNGEARSSAAGASIEAPKEPRRVGVGRGNLLPTAYPGGAFGASILAPAALDLTPPFANPGSATGENYNITEPMAIV